MGNKLKTFDKETLSVELLSKGECATLLNKYHYLTGISKGFKSGINFGLIYDGDVVGVCIFTGLPVPELAKSMFGLGRDQQQGLFELSRFCMLPDYQIQGGNFSSFFLSRCLKVMRRDFKARAILSYADSKYHVGTLYQACNFGYYGMTAPKKDFWILNADGSYTKQSRGKTKGVVGEWRHRTQKHRYAIVYDKKLNLLWEGKDFPKKVQ